jgi:hypothetical protein
MKDLWKVKFFMKIMLWFCLCVYNIWIFEMEDGIEIKLVCSNTHVIFVHLWWLLLFLCYKVELWSNLNPSKSKLCI